MDIENESNSSDNMIIITDIRYDESHRRGNAKTKDRPTTATLDIPASLLKTKDDEDLFKDNVESFAYNTLSRKFGVEISHCQVWLPLENND